MGEEGRDEGHIPPPEPTLQPIQEQESSPNSTSSSTAVSGGSSSDSGNETDTQNKSVPRLNLRSQQPLNSQGSQNGHPASTPSREQPGTPLERAAMNRQPTESGSTYYGSHDQQNSDLRNRSVGQRISRGPANSLAGKNVYDPTQRQGPTWVDPSYQDLNPRYGENNETPIWGLAKPLPRVVRPGMRRDESSKQQAYQPDPPGESQPAPELGATPGLSTQRSDYAQSPGPPTYSSAAQRDLAKEQAVYAPQQDGMLRPMETEASQNMHGQLSGMPVQDAGLHDEQGEEFLNNWVKIRHYMKEPFAEFLATTVAVFIGLAGTLAVTTGGTQAGSRISQNWSWGLGFMIGIYLAGGVSGAHLNPGISVSLWIFRGFPGRRCFYYVAAQFLGSIVAAGLAYCIYRDAIVNMAPTISAGSSGLGFYTSPKSYVSSTTAFFTEFVADTILLCVIFALGDDGNAPPGAGMHSFVIGLVIYVLCISLGFNTGGCFNAVRDIGPRFVALMAGYGETTFTERGGWWFWGCWVATISGCLTGAALYDTFIFIGGESPINYAPRRRRRAKLKKENKWRKRLGIGKEKVPSLEEGIKKLENEQ